jgi:hypothetical protein
MALTSDPAAVYVGTKYNQVIRYEPGSGDPLWTVKGDGDPQALAEHDGVIYIGGHFQSFNGQPEPHLAAVDQGGVTVDWAASADSSLGVWSISGDGGVFIGGDFTHVSGRAQQGFAEFLDPPPPPPSGGLPFSDTFDAGLAAWNPVANASLDDQVFAAAAPSLLLDASGGAGAFATRRLTEAQTAVCVRSAFDLEAPSASTILLRLQTLDAGPIARLYATTGGSLRVRSDFSGTTTSTGATLSAGWNTIQFCASIGTSGSASLALNGVDVGSWPVDLGTAGIGRFQLGDAGAKSFLLHVDDVAADSTPIP